MTICPSYPVDKDNYHFDVLGFKKLAIRVNIEDEVDGENSKSMTWHILETRLVGPPGVWLCCV